MDRTALLAHESLDAPLAWRNGRAIDVRRFLHDVSALSTQLPRARHVLNVCSDRYRFAVGLGACLLTGRVSLLPSTHTPDMIRRLRAFAPDVVCLTDQAECDIDLQRCPWQEAADAAVSPLERIPEIANEQLVAIVFTSGSTGAPLPYRKTWGRLSQCVRAAAARLALGGRRWTLIGTVPPQHMYGFESSVLLALLGGHSLIAERPFYPADIVAALGAAARPRALITTPIHLRTLIASGLELPVLDLLVSATAPLPETLAREAEQRFGTRLLEIYGSTETGQIATRRTTETNAWHLWPGVRLRVMNGVAHAEGGHIEQWTQLCDVIEPLDAEHFLLHGRTEDLVNVAGKRSSLAYLNAQLNTIEGVLDGAFFWPEEPEEGLTGVARLAAAVVAPGLSAAQLLDALRERIDPVFLPRPLLRVERLPRNATGKLPQHALRSLAATARAVARGT
ncbi:MAG TPA: AMP-binding protein [Steroidobacteraceae bacterium]|nr:AMP-binding protein [Steroidobacteraceae bacterium]